MKIKFDPASLRCPGTSKRKKDNWCYKVVGSPRGGYMVERRGQKGLLIVGFLAPGCKVAWGRKAKVFRTAQEADQAAQKCILKKVKK